MMTNFKSLIDLQKVLSSEQNCIEYFKRHIWGEKLISPFDPNSKVYKCANNQYRCKNTGKYFNVRTKTIFESSKISFKKWLLALYLFSSHKKGISSYQLAKFIDITQKSAWFVLQRLRRASDISLLKTMLKDFVEIDETYVGGKNKNRHWDKKVPNSQGRSWKDKTPVVVMIERGGNVITQVVPNVKRRTLEPIIEANVEKGSNVYTDEWLAYKNLGKWYNHQIVNHRIKQYVNGKASTNSAENFNSQLKRGIGGIYQRVSKKHLQKYTDEFALRFNTRKYSEKDRLDLVLSSTVGKRLTYQQLIS